MELRTESVAQLLVQGASRADIPENARTQWGVCRATADELIRRASLRIAEMSKATIDFERGRAIYRYNEIYRRAGERGWLMVQISAQTRLDEINGLTGKASTSLAIVNGGTSQGSSMAPETIAKINEVVRVATQSAMQEHNANRIASLAWC